jgi:exonuclease III
VRIVSWNLNVRRDGCSQVEALARLRPDVVVLQEVNAATWAVVGSALEAAGFPYRASGVGLLPPGASQTLPRFVAVASRYAIQPAAPACVPAPEVIVCVEIDSPLGPVEVIGVHVPTIAKGWVLKVETEEGLAARLAAPAGAPRIVCGDFNAPKAELPDGTVVPFCGPRDLRGRAAELVVVGDPGRFGLADAFRALHGYDAADRSWWWKRHGTTGGYRLDHIFASAELRPLECGYAHELREGGLSDHSPIYAEFERNPVQLV